MEKRYVIGLDYGTLSCRCILVDADTGETVAESVRDYPHGVMDEVLPDGQRLPPQWALQHPADYPEVMQKTVPDVLRKAGVRASDVKGIGIDFTACTLLPVDGNGVPLCCLPEWEHEKHAYVKLWKHHAAQGQADRINALAERMGETWIHRYGGKLSSEFALPKLLQTLEEAPEVYRAAARFLEAGDWMSWLLTGEETHSAVFAGYKAAWSAESGYPSNAFFRALDPRLDGVVGSRLSEKVLGVNHRAGTLNAHGAELVGLPKGTPLALPMIDAHAAMPALGVTGDWELMLIIGTSACQIVNAREDRQINGICGSVRDGVISGFYTYEAGQAGVGDIFDWFVRACVPASYAEEAAKRGIGLHQLLREKAERQKPGESGLLALDWWNGNRSVLVNAELSGMLLGMTLSTKPEDIYRALIEATAYGLRVIAERYEEGGVAIDRIVASGGIAQKDAMMMQIYADVLGRPIRIGGTTQSGALGSAIYAAVAGGIYPDVQSAAKRMAKPGEKLYSPNPEHHRRYTELYALYRQLHDLFGRDTEIMERLKRFGTQEERATTQVI